MVGVIGRSGAGKSLRQWRARCAMGFPQFKLVARLDVLIPVVMGRRNHVDAYGLAQAMSVKFP
jgi:ABC-type phosphate/phosphonate transport system ATPase subunit